MALIGWTLTYTAPGGSPVTKTFAEWNVSGVRLRRQSQAADELSFTTVEDVSVAPQFAYDGKIKLNLTIENGAVLQWYVGWVDTSSVSLSGTSRRQTYKVKGPWKWLELLVFQKIWYKAINPADHDSSIAGGYRGKMVLNMDVNQTPDTHQTVAQQMDEIIDYVNQCAVLQNVADGDPVIDMGTCPATLPPWSDVNSITCAEAVKHQLKWMPSAVTFFTYYVDPPQLNVWIPSNVITIPFSDAVIGEAGLTPRYDRQVSRVRLKFERSNSTDGRNWVYEAWDIYPAPATGVGTFLAPAVSGGYYYLTSGGVIVHNSVAPATNATPPPDNVFDELMLTINLVGWTEQYARANITSEAWGTNDWLKKKLGFLKDADATLVSKTLRKVVYQNGSEYIPGVSGAAPTLLYELVSGAVTDGLVSGDGTPVIASQYTAIYDVVHRKDGTIVSKDQDLQSIKFNATNAESGSYSGLLSSASGDPIPTGLAQTIYEGLSVLQHDGTIKIKRQHLDGSMYLGSKLTLTGGNPAWANMVIQAVDESIDTGELILTVGVPKYLSAGDMVELLRVSRNINRFIAPHTVQTGQGAATANSSPTRMQADNSAAGKGAPMVSSAVSTPRVDGVYPDTRMEVRTDAPGGKLQLISLGGSQQDSNGLAVPDGSQVLIRLSDSNGKLIKIREVEEYDEDCVLKHRLILCSELY